MELKHRHISRGYSVLLLLLILCLSVVACPPLSYASSNTLLRFSVCRTGGPLLDPHRVQGDLELHLNPNIFEGLMKIDPESGQLIPALATSYRWVTPKVIEFQLRSGVTFHNGELFDAEAVKYSFERMAAVTKGFNWIKALIPEFEAVEVVAPDRVRIHLREHNSIFLISSRFFVILPPKLLQEQGTEAFRRHPVGTGPYAVESIDYEQQQVRRIHLVRNQQYWQPGVPQIERVEFNFGLDREQSLKQLLAGELDAIGDLPIRSILTVKRAGLSVHQKGQGLLSWILFNLSKYKRDSPIWHPEVRQAILHAIDYQKILEVVFRNRARVNHQWAFPGLPGYLPDRPNYAFDLKRARELLAKAGYPDGFKLQAYCDDVSLDEAKIIRSSLAAIGIDIHFDVLDEATNNCIITSRRNPQSPCHEALRRYDLMIGDFGWGLPHNYVTHLHTFSLDSFASMVDEDYPGARQTVAMFATARHTYGEEEANLQWQAITTYEFRRLSVAGLVLKNTYYATRPDLDWSLYSSADVSYARYQQD